VANASSDSVEVLNTDASSLQPFLAADGTSVKHASLFNIRMACAVGLDDSNEIVIAGGNILGVG